MTENNNSLSEIFMELAGETRYDILTMLEKQRQKSAQMAKELNLTIQDTHRNTARLSKVDLIIKDSEGFFSLTPYGKILLSQLKSFRFIQKNKKYFTEHLPINIPEKFSQRFGNLQNCELIRGNFAIVDKWISMAEESKEYLKIMTSQVPPEFFKQKITCAKKGVHVFLIHGHNTIVPKNFKKEISNPLVRKLISNGTYKRKMIDKVQTMIMLNEKYATLFFPDLKGEPDMYYSLISDDPEFHDWCLDYFNYVWDDAQIYDESKITEI